MSTDKKQNIGKSTVIGKPKVAMNFKLKDGSVTYESLSPYVQNLIANREVISYSGDITLGDDGYWYVDGVKTNVKAFGVDGKDGAPGKEGKPFEYEDFTEEQLAALKGEPFRYEDFTEEELEVLKGKDGDTWSIGEDSFWYKNGEKTEYKSRGERGDAFTYNDFTPEQLEALKGKDFTFDDFTPEQLESLRGRQGDIGPEGPQGATGATGPQGPQGIQGIQGIQGEKGDKGDAPILKLSEDGQSILISSDGGDTWLMFERNFNKLRVLGYLEAVEDLPNSASAKVGDIYGVKKADEGIEPGNAAYDLWINTVTDWEEYPNEGEEITKVYDYDTELPSSATNGTVALVPVKDLTVDKEKVDGYKVYEFNKSTNGWMMLLNTAEIYASKDDIINYGDNVFALVQGNGKRTEIRLKEESVVSKKDYCRIVNNTNKSLLIIITQDKKRVFHSIGNGSYMIPVGCCVYLVNDTDFTGVVMASSMNDQEAKAITSLEYMPEGIHPYYILTEESAGDIYITPQDSIVEGTGEQPDGITVETKVATLLSFSNTYKLYKRKVEWKWFGTNTSITYALINSLAPYNSQDPSTYNFDDPDGNNYVNPEQHVPSVKAVKGAIDTETQGRLEADAALSNRIDTEKAEREDADNLLRGRVKTVENKTKDIANTYSEGSSELIEVKLNNDEALARLGSFNGKTGMFAPPIYDINGEDNLSLQEKVAALQTNVVEESVERERQDGLLQESINVEAEARDNADEAMKTRTSVIERKTSMISKEYVDESDKDEVIEIRSNDDNESFAKVGTVNGKKGVFTDAIYDINGQDNESFQEKVAKKADKSYIDSALRKVSDIEKTSATDEEEALILATDSGKEVASINVSTGNDDTEGFDLATDDGQIITSVEVKKGSDDSEVVEFGNNAGTETYVKVGMVDGKKGIFTAALYDLEGNPFNAFTIDTVNDVITIAGKKYKMIEYIE